jgi:hypothetical protein
MQYFTLWLVVAGLPAVGFGTAVDAVSGEVFPAASASPDSVSVRSDAETAVRRYTRRVMEAYMRSVRQDDTMRQMGPPIVALSVAADGRPSVIAALDGFAQQLPGDDWIAGHRVGLRIKQGWRGEAVDVARECRATRWWCEALLGFALHLEGRIVEAEAAFDASLEAMPPAVRCAWSDDVLVILRGELRDQFESTPCAEREGLERRIWWLANPLHIVPGNDRRTEQFSRMVAMQLHHETLHQIGGECSIGHHYRVLSGGWQSWWWTMVSERADLELEGYPMVPTGSIWREPRATEPSDWPSRSVREGERFLPQFGSLAPLEQQTAFFARGDSILVISAVGTSEHLLLAGMALSRNEEEAPSVLADTLSSGPFRFSARVPRDAYLVSVEAMGVRARAYRTRFGHRLPQPNPRGLGLSDLVLVDWEGQTAESLDEALPRMKGTDRVDLERELGLFWEIYGAPEGSTLDLHVTVRPLDRGFLRRIGEGLRIMGPRIPVSVQWREQARGGEVVGKELQLDLSALPSGGYEVVLEIADGSDDPVAAVRRIELIGG